MGRIANALAALAFALGAASGAQATMRFWALTNVHFEDGATAVGTFSYDDDTHVVGNWNVRVQAGAHLLPFTYLPGDSNAYASTGFNGTAYTIFFNSQEGGDNGYDRQLRITPVIELAGSGSSIPIDLATLGAGAGSIECYNCLYPRRIVSGSLTRVLLPPPVALVDVVEFHHAAFDHYFMSADANEINALDTGFFTGWARTGYSFKAYVTGSSAGGTIHPVCRYYGLPSAGLDSHFYSASTHECFEVNRLYGTEWAIESDNVFQIDLPNVVTGACPTGTVPVYRVFNHRPDANHRYTTSAAVRASMEALGWIREGYGPDATIMCAVGSP
jgi:hypothetical protein